MNRWITAYPVLLALFCVFVWGVSYAVIRSTVQQIPPMTLACTRHLLGALLLWPLVRNLETSCRMTARDHLIMLGLGLSGVSLYFAFENHGLKLTSASHGALIIALIPLGTELVHAWCQRRLPPPGVWIGTALALTGTVLLLGNADGVANLSGDLLMLGAVVSWIAYTFLVQRFAHRYPSLLMTKKLMWYGALALTPAMLFELWITPTTWPGTGAWGGLFFLTLFCSVVAYDFWNRAVPALGATRTNTLLYLVPVIGVAGGVVLLDEPVTRQLLIGGVLVFSGVVLGHRRGVDTAFGESHAS